MTEKPEIARIAEQQIILQQTARNSIMEQHAATFRWLLASLLAINGGGLIAVQNSTLSYQYLLTCVLAFFVGIACALLVAVIAQKSARRIAPANEEMLLFWVRTAGNGDFDETQFQKLQAELSEANRFSRYAQIPGWLAFVAFGVGLMTLTIAPVSISAVNTEVTAIK